MRMQDMRSTYPFIKTSSLLSIFPYTVQDNRALAQASAHAQENNVLLLVLFVISPQDYIAHDRGARRIDFMLRNLRELRG